MPSRPGLLLAVAAFAAGTPIAGTGPRPQHLSDADIVVLKKLPSPDGSRLLVEYEYDLGALGYGAGGTALLPAADLGADLRRFLLPDRFEAVRWEADGRLTVRVRYLACLRAGETCTAGETSAQGARVNVTIDDEIGDRPVLVEQRLTSPDEALELIAYRYPKGPILGPIHLSLARPGAPPPRYGNFYIGSSYGDRLLAGRWTAPRHLQFVTNSSTETLLAKEGFIGSGSGVSHDVVENTSLVGAYLWHVSSDAGAAPRRQ